MTRREPTLFDVLLVAAACYLAYRIAPDATDHLRQAKQASAIETNGWSGGALSTDVLQGK